MSDEAALLATIAAHPAEDTPRLMYADWLDEHRQSIRAEFIRVQIAIAQKEHLPRAILNRYVDLFKRNQELLDHHRGELLGPLAALPANAEIAFRRGFPSTVELSVGDFLNHSLLLASTTPQADVQVTAVLRRLRSFLTNPDTGCVTKLSGYSNEIDDTELQPSDDFNLIEGIERMTRLAVLDLEGCGIDDLLCDLAYNYSVPSLRDIDLSNNAITSTGVANLLRTDLPQQLHRLILGGNPISDDGAIALASRWPTGDADRLEYLNMRFTNIGQAGQRALLDRFGGRVDLF